MPADASIYNLLRPAQPMQGPLDSYAQGMKLKALMGQSELQDMQRRQLEKGIADEEATAAAYRESGGDHTKLRELLYGRGLVKPAMAAEKSRLEAEKIGAETLVKRMEGLSKAAGLLKERLPAVRDEASYQQYRDFAVSMLGPDMARQFNLPPAFDPEWVRNQLVKSDELFTPKPQEIDIGGSKRVIDMNPFTNPTVVGMNIPKTMTPDAKANAVTVPDENGVYRPNAPVISAKTQIAAAGAPRVNVDNRVESTYAQKVAGGAAERDESQVSAARAAVDNVQKLNATIEHLRKSDAITGMGSDVLKNVERARALFTRSKAAGKTVSDTELLDSMLGSDVFPMIQALGLGARGMDTPAEREFLRSVMTGTTAMNKDTLIRMTEIRRDIAKRAIDKYNARVESGELDRYFRYSGTPKTKIEVPKLPQATVTPTQEEIDAELRRRGVIK